ncbi:MAG: M1 family aminopeptidase, partial [Chloroflexota bacterium]
LSSIEKNTPVLKSDDATDETSGYDVRYMKMNLNIDPNQLYISGYVSTVIQARIPLSEIKMQLATDFTVDSIIYAAQHLSFTHLQPWDLIITLPQPLVEGERMQFDIHYHGVPSTAQGFGTVGSEVHEGVPAFWTLSEPYGARDWWPGKNDLTDKIDTTEIIINTPVQYRAASNGLLISDTVSGNTRINHWKHNYPIAPYLIGVAVTNYAVYTDTTYSAGTMVPVLNYVYPETLEEAMSRTESTAPLMELYTDLFIPYPFSSEKYGHAQFGWGGGMEHQTMTFLGRFDFEIIAHELAHQWFGDAVTLNSWHDIWLNEGFATYLSGLSYEHLFDGFYWPRWKMITLNVITALPGGSVYVDDTTNINRIFDSRLSYRKGSYVLHSMRWLIGDSAFFAACRNYLNDPQAMYGFASTDLLKSHMEASSGKDLTEFFNDWYYGKGYPSYTLNVSSNEDQSYTLELSQVTSDPSVDFFEMPVPVTFYSGGVDTTFILDHHTNGQTWIVNLPFIIIDSINIDPEMWLISGNNQILLDSSNPDLNNKLQIYPNPTKDFIRLSSAKRNSIVYISDIKGSEIMQIRDYDGFKWIDVSTLRKGVYIVKIKSNTFEAKAKLVKL